MRIFLAGGTGATGQVLVPLLTKEGFDLVLHVRPKSADKLRDERARAFELADAAALAGAMAGCDAVISLVGTMRQRFGTGDTYETSDVGSARQLVAAAQAAGVPRFLLLSSLGAGGMDPYSAMKGECERIVRESGLAWTIFRPSALVSPDDAAVSQHGRRQVPGIAILAGNALRALPGLSGWGDDVRPMPIDVLARAFVDTLRSPRDGEIVMGRGMWQRSG